MPFHNAPVRCIRHRLDLPRRTATPLLGLAAILLAGTAGPGLAQPVQISGPSPFIAADCTADDVENQPGTNYPETEIEPWIDANLADPENLIAGWQQDRWSNGGARGLVSAFSTDGGSSWTSVVVPGISLCSNGDYERASDPWVSIAPDGVAYFFSLATDAPLANGAFGANAMLVSRSFDKGASWETEPTVLVAQSAGQVLHDKNSLTADYTDADFAYAVWDRFQDFTIPPSASAKSKPLPEGAIHAKAAAGDGVAAARERRRQLLARGAGGGGSPPGIPTFFEGPVLFSRTINGGATWETPKEIFDPGSNAQTINNLVVVQPDGDVFDFFTHLFFSGQLRIGFVKSEDKGATFSSERLAQKINSSGAVTPDTEQPIRDASILFDVAVNRDNGNLYLVWQDTRFGGVEQVSFSMSTNDGLTWSAPIRINQTPSSPGNHLRRQAFVPSIEVAENGRLIVTYYDFRNDENGPEELADHWAVFCDPAAANCRKKQGWGNELRLTADSFDIALAPVARALFLGDYMGLVASGNTVYPAFGVVDGQQETSIFTRPIDVSGSEPVVTTAKR
jgi:hypothetical protein